MGERLLAREVYAALTDDLGATLHSLGFRRRGRGMPTWERSQPQPNLFIWLQVDNRALDPFSGGQFTVEFERAIVRTAANKLGGRARVEQLLDPAELQQLLALQNRVIASLERPPENYVAELPAFLRGEYWKLFSPEADIRFGRTFLRYKTIGDVHRWGALLRDLLPTLVARASALLDPRKLQLGGSLLSPS